MFVGAAVDAAQSSADAFGSASPTTTAAVIIVPVAVIFLVWLVVRRGATRQLAAQAKEAAAAAAEQSAKDAFLRAYSDWTDHSYSLFDKSFIAVDMAGRQIALGSLGSATTYSFDALTGVDVVKDGGVLTVHRDTPGPSALGNLYFETSRLLKAIESPTNTVPTVKELSLKVTVDDPRMPVYEISFLHVFAAIGLQVSDAVVVEAAKRMDRFQGYLANALRPRGATSPSLADELTKLWELKQAGAISESEYADQKAKLLSA
jgi:hypothetical protein